MRSGRFKEAREVLDELSEMLSPACRRVYSRGLAYLDGERVTASAKLISEADKARDSFIAGVLALAAGDLAGARTRLEGMVTGCEANPLEWGTTFRWEIAKARELLEAVAVA